MTHEQKRIRGYEAAYYAISEYRKEARDALEPHGKRQGRTKTWWEGYAEGLLAAQCIMILGGCPDHHTNPKEINEILKREKKRKKGLAK